MKETHDTGFCRRILLGLAFCAGMAGIFFQWTPQEYIRGFLLIFCSAVMSITILWALWQSRQLSDFSNDICETVDILMEGRELKNFSLYEETAVSKVQEKLLQYYEKMKEEQQQSRQDKQTIQELVSDISHQVKTPTANIRMLTGILSQHELSREKQNNFLDLMTVQVNKLDFLMQSLIKMSRLETGTLTLHIGTNGLYDTIAKAVSGIWAKAERKKIEMTVECDSRIAAEHDPRWTAEALENILDNGVKYTPQGGSIHIHVRPWQFYMRIDISDTGMGIEREHYHDVFRRFYRGQEAAAQEGVGLGLYLARGIITAQKGYISVKSSVGEGSTFSVFLPE